MTNQFAENLQEGAKREIPKIAHLAQYRAAIAPHVKRRLAKEPDVAPFVKIRDPEEIVTTVDFERRHLAFYLKAAEDFAAYYRQAHRDEHKHLNLVALLARIGAVRMAANFPQHGIEGIGTLGGLTAKQLLAVERLSQLTAEGHKTILFAQNPGVLEILARALTARGLEAVLFHGNIPVTQRTRALNTRFRYGPAPILLATYGVSKKGLNLWQADWALLYDRQWTDADEAQAIRRLCRPQQTRPVTAERLHHRGSIDEYMGQMVAFKREAAHTGLDWGTPALDGVEYLHLDTLLGRFCDDLAERFGVKRRDLREALAA